MLTPTQPCIPHPIYCTKYNCQIWHRSNHYDCKIKSAPVNTVLTAPTFAVKYISAFSSSIIPHSNTNFNLTKSIGVQQNIAIPYTFIQILHRKIPLHRSTLSCAKWEVGFAYMLAGNHTTVIQHHNVTTVTASFTSTITVSPYPAQHCPLHSPPCDAMR